jgi:hypothetical protein
MAKQDTLPQYSNEVFTDEKHTPINKPDKVLTGTEIPYNQIYRSAAFESVVEVDGKLHATVHKLTSQERSIARTKKELEEARIRVGSVKSGINKTRETITDQKNPVPNNSDKSDLSRRKFLELLVKGSAVVGSAVVSGKLTESLVDAAKNKTIGDKKISPIMASVGDKVGEALVEGAKNFNDASEKFGKAIFDRANKFVEAVNDDAEAKRLKRFKDRVAQINNIKS